MEREIGGGKERREGAEIYKTEAANQMQLPARSHTPVGKSRAGSLQKLLDARFCQVVCPVKHARLPHWNHVVGIRIRLSCAGAVAAPVYVAV